MTTDKETAKAKWWDEYKKHLRFINLYGKDYPKPAAVKTKDEVPVVDAKGDSSDSGRTDPGKD